MWDVICIGAGPSGSTTARVAAEGGLSVLLVEKRTVPGKKSHCAGGMGWTLAEKLSIEEIIEKRIYSIVSQFGTKKMVFSQERPFLVMVQRSRFDRLLAERAEKAGAKLRTSSSVIGAEAGCVTIKDKGTGKIYKEKTRFIVFADGVNSIAHKTMGIGFKRDKKNLLFAVSYEIEYKNNPIEEVYLYFKRELPWAYYWIFPKKDLLDIGVGGLAQEMPQNLWRHLDQFFRENDITRGRKIVRKKGGPIPCQLGSIFSNSSSCVVGDAGGMVNPLTGGGIFYAIDAGEIAGMLLRSAIESNGTLSSYFRRFLLTSDYFCLKTLNMSNLFCYFLSKLIDEPLYHGQFRFIAPVFWWLHKEVMG